MSFPRQNSLQFRGLLPPCQPCRTAAATAGSHRRQLPPPPPQPSPSPSPPPPLPPPPSPRLSLSHPILCKLETCRPDLSRFNQIHAHIVATGLFHDVFAASRLLKFLTCRLDPPDLRRASLLFSQIHHPDVYAYNVLLQAFSRVPAPLCLLRFYRDLLRGGLVPNEYTLCFLLAGCSRVLALWEGKQVHAHLCKMGLDRGGVHATTSLVHMYGDCGDAGLALQAFGEMRLRTGVSWSAMVGAYVTSGWLVDALRVFGEMTRVGVEPGNSALVCTLCACAKLGDLAVGRMVHAYVAVKGVELNVTLGTSLVDMYSKCGDIEVAAKVFSMMPVVGVGSWNCMINGLAMNGDGTAAIDYFGKMQRLNVQPNGVTFLGLLNACSHSGFVEVGAEYFSLMTRKYSLVPSLKHYGCLVDIYSRAGHIREALDVIQTMPIEPDVAIWGALFGACRMQGHALLGELVGAQLVKRLPHDTSGYLFLSDVYASSRRWDDVIGARKMLLDMKMSKVPGYSSIAN